MPPLKRRKIKAAEVEEVEKPVQPSISGEDCVKHPAVAPLIGKPSHLWSKKQISALALFLSNRSSIDIFDSSAVVKEQISALLPHIDHLTFTDAHVRFSFFPLI